MRLFIAINFNVDTRSLLLSLRDELRSNSLHGRFSSSENLHLTLAFLGECNAEQTAAAKVALNMLTFEPFSISINRVGRFKRKGGDIWWAGVQNSPELLKLQGELTKRLCETGFTLEIRKFSPHITLGREVETDYAFGKILPFGETVKSVELMKSERIAGKLTYSEIYRRTAYENNSRD